MASDWQRANDDVIMMTPSTKLRPAIGQSACLGVDAGAAEAVEQQQDKQHLPHDEPQETLDATKVTLCYGTYIRW